MYRQQKAEEVKGSTLVEHGQEAHLPLSSGNMNSELCSIKSLSSILLHSYPIKKQKQKDKTKALVYSW